MKFEKKYPRMNVWVRYMFMECLPKNCNGFRQLLNRCLVATTRRLMNKVAIVSHVVIWNVGIVPNFAQNANLFGAPVELHRSAPL